ncbi:uncharacterized protein [Amphiura filiformis]|uniref:uncharacterized protein n=1 Tax=Amphiura filiformis TaxID=82378 RepID=UPI003B21BC86
MAALRQDVIVSFGIPLLDMSATVDTQFLNKYKLGANDSVQANKFQSALYDDAVNTYEVTYVAGGAAQNTIRVAQWLLGAPKATTLFGCIGKDKFGDILQGKAEQEGVCVCYERHKELATGRCAVLITDNNRCLCAEFAAAKAYSMNHLQQPENWQHIVQAQILYVTGYFLHSSPDCGKLLAGSSGNKEGKKFCFNLSAPYICLEAMDRIKEIFPYIDILFGNEEEVKALEKELQLKNDCNTTQEIVFQVGQLLEKQRGKPCTVVITQGNKSTVVYHDSKLTEYPVVAVPPACIVDTCGAGDAFVGGFLAKLACGADIPECIRCGHYAAGKMIQCQGIQIPKEKADFWT